ncbi:MAG: RDD family protein [Mycobacterium sp.]|uniref:RDD family protein n=1 Tax=Mycobacterium sp. TaxID=1785 RepID=UPI002603C2BC|nr:RDD family protein [Mycobacterium sp.]MDI3313111.1 RDD family protein [Mycobacterium sp.]
MTALAADPTSGGVNDGAAPVSAPWTARAGALAVDILPGAAVLVATVLVALAVPLRGGWWWVCVSIGAIAMLWTAINRLLLPVIRGQSLGRAVFGVTVVHRNGGGPGPWRLLLRDLAHLLDTAPLLLGWLWPLWDSRGRTFADMLVGTEARLGPPGTPDRTRRRLAAAVMAAAAALCTVSAAISDTVVRRHDRAITDARAQIAVQGPRMVAQMLSYGPETIRGDFDRALSLASDNYRGKLSALQRAAQRAGPVRNEYWVTDSSVLSATPQRATMLLFLQGERGAPPNQRYLAAAVRVTFVKPGGASGWRVDDIAVSTEPKTAGAKP